MRRLVALGSILAVSLTCSLEAAGADTPSPGPGKAADNPSPEPSKAADKTPPPPPKPKLDHRFQIGLGLRAGTGYRVIMPYHEEDCGEKDKSVCGSRQPAWLELSPSFGITRALELLFDIRFSLEEDFTASRALFFSPGIKYYAGAEDLFKFYVTGQIVFETQEQRDGSGLDDFDVGVRSALGVQFDILRYVGLFAQGGIVVGFKRWLTFVVDFAGGVQVRY